MAYQTFPWQQGSSRSFEKLLSLYLPSLKDRSVLDVGCNTGYFCGWAAFQKARFVKGIDKDLSSIKQARDWFPECTFVRASWEELGPEKYDMVLCLSAIHYAEDQTAFVARLMDHVNADGMLVLELGVAEGDEEIFVPVARAMTKTTQDVRLFPTKAMVRRMLAPYVFKEIGYSVAQAGDPTPRQVYHVYHARPRAILFLDKHYSGKSSAAEAIIKPEITRISGDVVYHSIARGTLPAPQNIKNSLFFLENTTHLKTIESINHICENGFLPDLLSVFLGIADHQDFVLDSYIPPDYRLKLSELLHEAGYFVIDVALYTALHRPWTVIRPQFAQYQTYATTLERRYSIDEEAYLAANPDVAKAVAEGAVPSALHHYWNHGRKERRKLRP